MLMSAWTNTGFFKLCACFTFKTKYNIRELQRVLFVAINSVAFQRKKEKMQECILN